MPPTTLLPTAATLVLTALVGCGEEEGTFGAGGGDGGDGAADSGADDGGSGDAFALSSVPGRWGTLVQTLAVDDDGRAFVTDGDAVYTIRDGTSSTWLSTDDLEAALGEAPDIRSLSTGPDGSLYLLHTGVMFQGIAESTAAGELSLLRDLSDVTFPALIAVVDRGNIALVNHYDGLWQVTADGATLVVPEAAFQGGTDCATEALSATADGHVFYLPGCNGSGVVVADLGEATASEVLAAGAEGLDDSGVYYAGIGPTAGRDAALLNYELGVARVQTDGRFEPLSLSPSFSDLAASGAHLHGADVAQAGDGTLYVQTSTSVYVGEPR